MYRRVRLFLLALTGLSALLCVTSLALWVIRGHLQLNVQYNLGDPQVRVRAFWFQASSTRNTLSSWFGIQRFEPTYIAALTPQAKRDMQYIYAPAFQFNYLSPRDTLFLSPMPEGFRVRYYQWSAGVGHRSDRAMFGVPHWAVTVLTALPPGWMAVQSIRRKRTARQGHCKQCGYDLRATPTQCPECGSLPAHQSATTPNIDAIPK